MNLLLLTCKDQKEADNITEALLNNRLIVCSKSVPVKSQFFWKGNINKENEVLVVMESDESKFKLIEEVVRGLHSYEQFVLVGFPLTQMAHGVEKWLDDGLK
jgi:periplasmic divalent cation tolerance protein